MAINMFDSINKNIDDKDQHLYDVKKVVYSKDDVRLLNSVLLASIKKNNTSKKNEKTYVQSSGSKYGISKITGQPRKSSVKGFKVSAKCRPEVAPGHNRRDPSWVKYRENVNHSEYHKTYLDFETVEKSYYEVFKEALEEYNNRQTRNDRKIKNYYKKIMEDGRNGTMKKNADVDTHRKLVYEFIFQIGKRDKRLDTRTSIEILEKFVLEYIPEHYPNLKAIGIYLHADEFTLDPITKEYLEGAVHIHFDFIPVAHALTKEEQEEEKKWRTELEEQARTDAKTKGIKFSKAKFDEQDWEMMRVKKFGKALQKGMLLQSSMSGACAEMGFRTKGKLTAQIQMEEDIRTALLDFTESYGISVNREVDKNRDEEVSIDAYKIREDNKRLMEQIEIEKTANERLQMENIEKSKELKNREEKVKKLEIEKRTIDQREKDVTELANKIAPYAERIDNLEADEKNVKKIQEEQESRNNALDIKEKQIETKFCESLKTISEKQKELDSTLINFENEKAAIEKSKKLNKENEETNTTNAAINEYNAKEILNKVNSFQEKTYQYKMMEQVCGHADDIRINIEEFGNDLKNELTSFSLPWRTSVDKGVNNFTKKCNQILFKFKDAIRGFKNFLEGKTSSDFRKLADDMDRNGTGTFEEYEKKYISEELDWQVQQKIQKYTLKPTKKKNIEMER